MIDRDLGYGHKQEVTSDDEYEVTDDFNNLDAVGVIILNPEKDRILLVRRLVEKYDDLGKLIEPPKEKRNKVDANGEIILALPSGSGPLSDNPDDPDSAILKEVLSETGSQPIHLEKFHTYRKKGGNQGKKVGFYIATMSPDSLNPSSPHKDWPGWFPKSWFGTRITLPYAEHNQVVLDYLRERA